MRDCFWLLLFSIFCLVACESYPKDPNSTLERAKGAQLMIGAIHAPPWVNVEGEKVTGIEADIAMMAAYVKQNQGKPILLDSAALREYHGLIVDYESRLKALSVKTADWSLATEKHVLTIPKGENHFLVTLEKHLNEIGY